MGRAGRSDLRQNLRAVKREREKTRESTKFLVRKDGKEEGLLGKI